MIHYKALEIRLNFFLKLGLTNTIYVKEESGVTLIF